MDEKIVFGYMSRGQYPLGDDMELRFDELMEQARTEFPCLLERLALGNDHRVLRHTKLLSYFFRGDPVDKAAAEYFE